jgi:hypothetical protein
MEGRPGQPRRRVQNHPARLRRRLSVGVSVAATGARYPACRSIRGCGKAAARSLRFNARNER